MYVKKLEKVLELLELGESIDGEKVEEELGVDVSAHRSVPTAIYSFLRALQPIPNIEVCFVTCGIRNITNLDWNYFESLMLVHYCIFWLIRHTFFFQKNTVNPRYNESCYCKFRI